MGIQLSGFGFSGDLLGVCAHAPCCVTAPHSHMTALAVCLWCMHVKAATAQGFFSLPTCGSALPCHMWLGPNLREGASRQPCLPLGLSVGLLAVFWWILEGWTAWWPPLL
jgi:hypothetical protein